MTKKEAKNWEARMRRKPVEEWNRKTVTACLGDWAQAYLDVARVRFSVKTYKEKVSMFKRFFKVVNPSMAVSALKPAHVLDYIIKQKEVRSGYAANKDRKNLVAAWNWGIKYMSPTLQSPNPCLVERMPEVRQPRYVPPEEDFWKMYDAAKGQDKVMLLTFLHLAARRGEVFRMQWSDIDFGSNRIRLWTRKRKDGAYEYDWLPMTQELRKALRSWWQYRPIKDHTHVFLCLDKTAFTREHYGQPFRYRLQFMRKLCDNAKVKPFGFHAIRHLSASILFNLGYDLGVIQTILRHQSPSTTERYLKSIGMERVRDALESLSSKSKSEVVTIGQAV
ncbi:MAG: tyrosine-type recombinase/integrase [Deltaproteobacteria bacterium]|nr:tyrosine-type recombinase/integrase [Deltaproteobacteria bacterium]